MKIPRPRLRFTTQLGAACLSLILAAGSIAAQGTVLPGSTATTSSSRATAGSGDAGNEGNATKSTGSGAASAPESEPAAGPTSSSGGAASGPGLAERGDLDEWSWWWEFRRAEIGGRRARRSERPQLPDVLPTLLEHLNADEHQAPLRAAILGAAKSVQGAGDSRRARVEERLVPLLAHDDRRVVETTLLGLGLLGRPSATLLLADFLRAAPAALNAVAPGRRRIEQRERSFAALALGTAAARSSNEDLARFAVHHLVNALDDCDAKEHELACVCLAALGQLPLDFEADAAFDVEDLRALANERLREARPASASGDAQLVHLLVMWTEGRVERRVLPHLLTTLATLCSEREVPSRLRELVLEALLEGLLEQRDRAVRRAAALALGWVANADDTALDRRARRGLEKIAASGADSFTRSIAWLSWIEASTRGGAGGPAANTGNLTGTILHHAQRARGPERAWATLGVGWFSDRLRAAGKLPPAVIASTLCDLLSKAKSPSDRASLAAAVGLADAAGCTDFLCETLSRSSAPSVRAACALALGLLDDASAEEALLQALERSQLEPRAQREAALALSRLGTPNGTSALLRQLGEARSLPSRGSLAAALGEVQDPRSVEALLALFRDRESPPQLRAFAGVALGQLADTLSTPWRDRLFRRIPYFSAPPVLYDELGNGILNLL